MQLYRKVRAVEKLFAVLEKDVARFQENTQLGCVAGCGKCCFKADIQATALEFLPLAYYLLREGQAEAWYEQLRAMPKESYCVLLAPLINAEKAGFCSAYPYRGLVCRLFGFSATLNKYGQPVLATCKTIKETQSQPYTAAQASIDAGLPVPLGANYYLQLRTIDPELGTTLMPINQAIRRSLEVVLSYYSYRKKPRRRRAA